MALWGGTNTGLRTFASSLEPFRLICASTRSRRQQYPSRVRRDLASAAQSHHSAGGRLLGVRAMSSTAAAPAQEPQQQSAAEPPSWMQKVKANFCRVCGGRLSVSKPSGDKEWRHVCGSCGYVDYHNPKMVVGCVVEHRGQILLCRRAIEPCRGLWTLPAGFMELNESTAAGAARETWEEANAEVQIIAPYAHWDIPLIGQAYILFRARLAPPYTFSSGPESLEVRLFAPEDIPFDHLAFSSVAVTLRLYLEDMRAGAFRVHHGVIDKRPGSLPNEPGAFQLREHVALELAPHQQHQQPQHQQQQPDVDVETDTGTTAATEAAAAGPGSVR
ncbi:hypothetical protein PLESTB_001208800 [Pleodorina starrii]|uniref:Nudix hydrolase domain-containing protein n=1 Tax=Pleodorina starrii TaxID=330485 RepID=A0A9W6BSS5_9CHLO|nr:hypothetical protein PLESTM_001650400 [Pleodorina starrii]GLC57295.1 hypothetical protein PLESTB_001208800 [Pleodorina starrii]GLC71313.1 hypothetical protein PLESTF_001101900 [Pleodorina starrii]